MPDGMPDFAGVNPNIAPSFNNPFGPMGVGMSGNAANHGFAPSGGITTGNPTFDMLANMIAQKVLGNAPMMRTFGRPGVSDYAYTAMQERQRAAAAAMPAVSAMDPFLRSLGPLGKSPAAQMAINTFGLSPGGSMSEAFNVVMGRFGSRLAGPGIDNGGQQAAMAMNMLQNANAAMTDKNGLFDYRSTAGFTRSEAFRNLADWTEKFGGNIPSVLASKEGAGNKEQMDKAKRGFTEINETVREAQNLFGQDKGIGELMQSVENLIEGSTDMTPGKVKGILQKVQGLAAVVDMSNESITRYFDMMKNLYEGMGVRGNTTERAQQDLMAGKAIVDARKAKMKDGEVYTGPDQTEEAQRMARSRVQVETSPAQMQLDAAITQLSEYGEEGDLSKQLVELRNAGKTDEALKLLKNANLSENTRRNITTEFEIYSTKGQSEQSKKYLRDRGVNSMTTRQVAEQQGRFVAGQLMNGEVGQEVRDKWGDRGAQVLNDLFESGKLSSDNLNDMVKTRNALQEGFQSAGLSGSAADFDALTKSMERMRGKNASLDESMGSQLMSGEARERYDLLDRQRAEQAANVRKASERSPWMRNLNAGDAVSVMAGVYQGMVDKKRDAGSVTFEDAIMIGKDATKRFLGMDPNSEEYKRGKAAWDLVSGKNKDLQGKLENASKEAKDQAEKEAKDWDRLGIYGTDPEGQKERDMALRSREDEIRTSKEKEILASAGLETKEASSPDGGDKDKFDSEKGLSSILEKLDRMIKAVEANKPKDAGAEAPTDQTPDATVPNKS